MSGDLILAFIIIFLIQLFFFVFAATFQTDKLTDLAYGITFVIVSIFFLILGPSAGIVPKILTLMITIWGLRLTGFLFIRILSIGKDSRFDKIRGNPVKFGGFWFLQTASIWIIILPTTILLSSNFTFNLNLLAMFGIIVWLVGFAVETISDQQKSLFRKNPENKGKFIQSGLWKYSRHPNYFGEILVWWGIFFTTLSFLRGWEYLAIASPLFISFLLIFVSGIPPLEKKADEMFGNNSEYQDYKSKTPILIPLPK